MKDTKEVKDTRKIWTAQEDKNLIDLQKIYGHNWVGIADEMNIIYKNNARGPQQCKQRFLNKLSPKVNKNQWSKWELHQIFESHKKYPNQWTKINHSLRTNRTDSGVKNQFYSAIRRALRRINKIIGRSDSTAQINSIKPKQLSNLLKQSSSQACKNQMTDEHDNMYELLFDFSDNQKQAELKEKAKDDYYREKLVKIIDKALWGVQKCDKKVLKNKEKQNSHSQQQQQCQEQQQNEAIVDPSKIVAEEQKIKKANNILNQDLEESFVLSQEQQQVLKQEQPSPLAEEQQKPKVYFQAQVVDGEGLNLLTDIGGGSIKRIFENSALYRKQINTNFFSLSSSANKNNVLDIGAFGTSFMFTGNESEKTKDNQ